MPFARRQAESVRDFGINVRLFFLKSRTAPLKVVRELRRLQHEIREFEPDVLHAQFGTMTAFVAAFASRKPLVITFHGSDLNPTPGDSRLKSKLARLLSHVAANRSSNHLRQPTTSRANRRSVSASPRCAVRRKPRSVSSHAARRVPSQTGMEYRRTNCAVQCADRSDRQTA